MSFRYISAKDWQTNGPRGRPRAGCGGPPAQAEASGLPARSIRLGWAWEGLGGLGKMGGKLCLPASLRVQLSSKVLRNPASPRQNPCYSLCSTPRRRLRFALKRAKLRAMSLRIAGGGSPSCALGGPVGNILRRQLTLHKRRTRSRLDP